MIVTVLPGSIRKIDVFENERLGFGIAEPDIAQFDAAVDRTRIADRAIVPGFAFAQHNVRETLDMQLQYPEIECRLDQRDRLVHEGLLVGHDRENHADRQLSGQRHHDGKIDRHDVFEAEDRFVQRA